jgi:hypothetical protein
MRSVSWLFGAIALGLPFVSFADPDQYVHEPSVEYGEREIDFKAGTARFEGGDRASASSLGFGWGATTWWFTEAYIKYEKEPGERFKYDAFEWENKFQLTEPNQYPVDVGFLTEIEIPRARHEEGYEFKAGPLFQSDAGPIRWNANLLFERVFRGHTDEDAARHTEIGYEFQAKHHVRREFEFGAQAFGEMGRWDHWLPTREQNHRLGPAIFGFWKLEGREGIRYNAAWLVGATKAAPDHTVRVQVEYEF